MPPINSYDQQLLRKQAAISRRILKIYQEGIVSLTPTLNTIKFNGKLFNLADYPALKQKVDTMVTKLQPRIYATVVNGVKDSWDLSNQKNNVLVDKRLAGKKPNTKAVQVLYDPNKKALNAFLMRREKGLGLSERVWNTLEPFKTELEQGLGLAIAKGQPAKDIAKELQKNLKEPDRLFRRVKNDEGKLVLSKAAREYQPGQGVYRSSYKNSLRLARTETNMSYRNSDYERWQKLPFVTGIRIKLSNAHPQFDICDSMVGLYPKDFRFAGWHPQCICFATPEMMNDEEYDKIEDQLLEGKAIRVASRLMTKETPPGFKQYLADNAEKLGKLKNEPYWIRDNKKYLNESKPDTPKKQKPPKENQSKIQPGGERIGNQFTKIEKQVAAKVKSALNSIDQVHGDGIMDNIPFEKERKRVAKGVQAAFYMTQDGKPLKIALNNLKGNSESSLVHEIGHLLDLQNIGEKGSFNSKLKDSPVNKVIAKAMESEKIKGLKEIIDNGYFVRDGAQIPISSTFKSHLKYLISPEEIWARSYTQFIAKRSGSKALSDAMDDVYELHKRIPHRYQWDPADFAAIEKEIEDMMVELGWINRL